MSDNTASIVIDGNVSPLRAALRQAAQDMQNFGNKAGSGIGSAIAPLEALQTKFIAIGAVLAGGAIFKVAVDAAAQLTEQSIQLGRAMGVSATEASGMIAALEDVGATQDEFGAASKGLTRNLRDNEAALQAMGLQTRDAAGNFRPMNELMLDAVGVVNQYADGADRNAAAQMVFGKSVDGTSKLLNLQAETVSENKALLESLGATVGEDAVANFQAYDAAMDKAHLTVKAMQSTIGNALMPVLTEMANGFVRAQQETGALQAVVSALNVGLKSVVTVAANVAYVFRQAGVEIGGMAAQMAALLSGDFKGFSFIGEQMKADAKTARKELDDFVDRVWSASDAVRSSLPSDVSRYGKAEQDGGNKRMPKPSSDVQKLKVAKAEKQPDEAKLYDKALAQHQQYIAEWMRGEQIKALGAIEIEQAQAQTALANGEITKAQMLEQEQAFEARRYEIMTAALNERLALLMQDPNYNPVERQRIMNEQLALEQQHQIRLAQLSEQVRDQVGGDGLFDGIGQSFGQMLSGMLTRTQTWGQRLGGLMQSISQQMIQTLAIKPVTAWIASQAQMLAAKLGFAAEEKAVDLSSASTSVAATATAATAKVGANAAVAGSGAASAMSSIPYVGPILALAAMGAMIASVMGLQSNIKSARGGYDIPAGINPMVQLHEEEMVLPSKYANTIRGLAGEGGDAGAQGSAINLTVSTPRPRDFVRDVVNNGEFAKALKELKRKRML
jgi:hypothetical protein